MSGHIPIQFTVEITRPCNPVFPVYKGESFTVRAVLTDHGQPFVAALSDPKLYYQTADMGVAWWSLPATQDGNVVTAEFPANAIPNRERLNCFLGSAGENFHASFTMDFRHSPGVTPNEIDLPVPVLNFAEIEVLNAPYYTTTEADTKFLSKDDAAAGYQPKGDYKSTQSPVADPTASQETSTTFISGITQNEQGVIAPVKKTLPPFQAPLTFDTTPTLGSQNPVTSDGIKKAIDAATTDDYAQVKEQVQQNTQDITGIEGKIPAQASAQNQLADKAFVNSSIATNTATFRGTYNLVSDLGLTTSATEQAVASAIATHLAALVPPVVPENNDYCFVQVPRETSDPTVIDRIDRYKCTVTESGGVTTRAWEYEWSLNNSSFTAAQWKAINSGITRGLVEKLNGIQAGAQVNTVTGVKGNAEQDYRIGNINLTPANIGALSSSGGTVGGSVEIQNSLTLTGSSGHINACGSIRACGSVYAVKDISTDANLKGKGVVLNDDIIQHCASSLYTADTLPVSYDSSVNAVLIPGAAAGGCAQAYEAVRKGDVATSSSFGLVKIGSGLGINSSGCSVYVRFGNGFYVDSCNNYSVKEATTSQRGIVQIDNTGLTASCTYPGGSSIAQQTAITTAAFAKGLRYLIPNRGSSFVDPLDRTIVHEDVYGCSTSGVGRLFTLPTAPATSTGLAKDFIIDITMLSTETYDATIGFTGLGTEWAAALEEGWTWDDIVTFHPGEQARIYFTETGFVTESGSTRIPVYMVSRHDVNIITGA